MNATEQQFKPGQIVKKVTGDYQISGIVRSVFPKGDGAIRVVVEHYVADGHGEGSFLHIYGPSNLMVLREAAAGAFELTPQIAEKIARWALGDDTGVSSETIAAVALGMDDRGKGYDLDTPSDSSDFGRCYRLLKLIPELRQALPLVVEKCPKWGPLVEVWDELTELYEKDLAEEPVYADARRIVNKRSCYDRIKGLYDACMIAGGWVKKADHWWVRPEAEAADA